MLLWYGSQRVHSEPARDDGGNELTVWRCLYSRTQSALAELVLPQPACSTADVVAGHQRTLHFRDAEVLRYKDRVGDAENGCLAGDAAPDPTNLPVWSRPLTNDTSAGRG